MKNKTRKNCFHDESHVQQIKTIAEVVFGSSARWSAAMEWILEQSLPTIMERVHQKENERLEGSRKAIELRRTKLANDKLNAAYLDTLPA